MFKETYHYLASVVSDLLLWAFQVAIGVGTKLALESRRRHLTKKYVFTSFVIASFVGYITDKICTSLHYDQFRGVAVAIMALLSESIVRYFDENAGQILDAILRRKTGLDIKNQNNGTNIDSEDTTPAS
jgi:hypothetical protein